MADHKSVILKIKRQLTPSGKSYWEEFSVPYRPNMNVISALMDIAADPVDARGQGDHADHVRLELPGRGLRVVRHADQWQGADGMLGAD